jgi:predicted dehydrogenase
VAELRLVVSTREAAARRLAEAQGATGWSTDYQAVLADPEIDAVSICTPSGTHADLAVAALQAGKHVLVEKPIDVSLEAADRTIDLLVAMLGVPTEVFAYAGRLAHERVEVEDTAVAVVRFAGGALGMIHGTTAAYPGLDASVRVFGTWVPSTSTTPGRTTRPVPHSSLAPVFSSAAAVALSFRPWTMRSRRATACR